MLTCCTLLLTLLVNLQAVPSATSVPVGGSVAVTVETTALEKFRYAGVQILVQFDPAKLHFTGWNFCDGGYWYEFSGFIPDGLGINDTLDDGEGIWVGFGYPGYFPVAGNPIVEFTFEATMAGRTEVVISGFYEPYPGVHTIVAGFGGVDITGELTDGTILIYSPVPLLGSNGN